MNWNALKIVAVVALLASPSAIAATPGPGAPDRAADTLEVTPMLQLAEHRGGRPHRLHDQRPAEFRGDHGRYRDGRRGGYRRPPHYRDHRHPYYRGRPHHRRYRGWPPRRWYRHWWRYY